MRPAWLAFAFVCLMAQPGEAHEFYTGLVNANGQNCCGGHDCKVVPAEGVRGSPLVGFEVLNFMDQTEPQWLPVPETSVLIDVRPPDGRMHACIWGGEVKCLILPSVM